MKLNDIHIRIRATSMYWDDFYRRFIGDAQ